MLNLEKSIDKVKNNDDENSDEYFAIIENMGKEKNIAIINNFYNVLCNNMNSELLKKLKRDIFLELIEESCCEKENMDYMNIIKYYVEELKMELDSKSKYDEWTPLILAIEYSHIELIKYLLKAGASKDYRNSFGQTPMERSNGRLKELEIKNILS
jgi:ankyrin repeat protein